MGDQRNQALCPDKYDGCQIIISKIENLCMLDMSMQNLSLMQQALYWTNPSKPEKGQRKRSGFIMLESAVWELSSLSLFPTKENLKDTVLNSEFSFT